MIVDVDRSLQKLPEEAFECATPYRGYRWFDRYELEQLLGLGRVVDDLCERFAIPRVYPEQPFLYYDAASASYQDLSQRYIAELKKPRIRLPSLVGLVGLRVSAW